MKTFFALRQTLHFFRKAIRYLSAVLLLFCAAGCTKNLPGCSGNCTVVTFSGTVTDLSANAPMKNTQIRVYLFPRDPGGIFSENPDILAAKGGSNRDGTFSFSPTINIGYFNTYTTGVNAYLPDGYLQYPIQVQPQGYERPDDYTSLLFQQYDSAGFRHLDFGFYQQTLLQIHAHRTSTASPNSFVEMEYGLGIHKSGASFPVSALSADTTVSVYTGANVYTVIKASTYVDTSYVTQIDSIRCTKQGPNTMDLYY